jgi:hypothetical protein
MRRLFLGLLLVGVSPTSTVWAGPVDFPKLRLGIFDKKKKEDPSAKVKQLTETLKSDTDEKKRLAAAKELKDYDTKTNSEVLPALINSLRQDPSASVRAEAAESLGKAKPISTQAGVALEMTVSADPSETVRKAAQGALWQYHLAGYKGNPTTTAGQTAEPPLAGTKPKTVAPSVTAKPIPTPMQALPVQVTVGRGTAFSQTIEPPLAKPKSITPPAAPIPQTVPSVPQTVPSVPQIVPPSGPVGIPGIPTVPSPGGN